MLEMWLSLEHVGLIRFVTRVRWRERFDPGPWIQAPIFPFIGIALLVRPRDCAIGEDDA